MKPLENKINQPKTVAQETNAPRAQQVNPENRRVVNNENTTNQINNNFPLSIREINVNPTTESDYSKLVCKAIKSRIITSIERINIVLVKEPIQYNEDDSIDSLALKTGQGYSKICEDGLKARYEEIAAQSIQNQLTRLSYADSEPFMNAVICWITLQRLYETEKPVFPVVKFAKHINPHDVTVQGIDVIVNEAITDLKTIIEKYFSVFRILFNPGLKLNQKLKIIGNYSPSIGIFYELLQSKENNEFNNIQRTIGTLADFLSLQISRVQNLLECLNTMKHSPKTLTNLTEVHHALESCYNTNYKNLSSKTKFKSNPQRDSELKVKSILRNLCLNFAQRVDEATIKNNALIAEARLRLTIQNNSSTPQINPSPKKPLNNKSVNNRKVTKITPSAAVLNSFETKQPIKNQGKKKKPVINKSNDAQRAASTKTPLNNSQQESCLEKHDLTSKTPFPIPLKDRTIIEIIEPNPVEEKQEPILNIETTPNTIILDQNWDDEDLDDIEPETIALMEVLRQFFDKDRAAKLELKKAKLNQPKIVIEEKEDLEIPVIETKFIIQILNHKLQETLKALFQTNPPHLTISGQDVKTLITALNGRSVGATGSQFTISWNGSNKHAGEYEVAHGGDRKGYLTSKYASRVADAIHIGLKHNCIIKDLFPQELLTLIETHIIQNNT